MYIIHETDCSINIMVILCWSPPLYLALLHVLSTLALISSLTYTFAPELLSWRTLACTSALNKKWMSRIYTTHSRTSPSPKTMLTLNVSLTKRQISSGASGGRHSFTKKGSLNRIRVKIQTVALLMRMKKPFATLDSIHLNFQNCKLRLLKCLIFLSFKLLADAKRVLEKYWNLWATHWQ